MRRNQHLKIIWIVLVPVISVVCYFPLCNDLALCLQPGEVVYEEDCNTKCTCDPAKGLICAKHSCPQNTKCMVRKGKQACYNTGKSNNCIFVLLNLTV